MSLFVLPRPLSCLTQGILLLILVGFALPNFTPARDQEDGRLPNIVLINMDDTCTQLLGPSYLQEFYPHISNLAQAGIRFTNVHVTTPFCGPSRAALFRGQYAFNTGIKVNNLAHSHANGFDGGYPEFVRRGYHQNELGVWMKQAGYRTIHVGKYHHARFDGKVPPGWDDFSISLGSRYRGGRRFFNLKKPGGEFRKTGESEYITTVESDEAVELIHLRARNPQPFFLYLATKAPHTPKSPDLRNMADDCYRNFASDHKMPTSPDLFEDDFSDKPRHLRHRLNERQKEKTRQMYFGRLRAVKAIDDLVGSVVDALRAAGALESTYIFLTSDNGFQTGHHNLMGKTDPFDRSTKVPLFVRGPGIVPGKSADHLIAHIDICPTILEIAGAKVPEFVDAKSFRELLFVPDKHEPESWQPAVMIENWSNRGCYGRETLGAYVAYRTHHQIFVSWANGEREYYDLKLDPFQLNNHYERLGPEKQRRFEHLIRQFRARECKPITTVNQSTRNRFLNQNILLEGFAEDNSDVVDTHVVIRSVETGKYWNGSSWQDNWIENQINLQNPNQPISAWNFQTNLTTETKSGLDSLEFSYRSLESNADKTRNDERAFKKLHVNKIDGLAPTSKFDSQIAGEAVFDNHFALTGNCFDGVELESVQLSICNQDKHQFYNGNEFQVEPILLPAKLHSDMRWSLELELPEGVYVAKVQATDKAGNRQPVPDALRFRVAARK